MNIRGTKRLEASVQGGSSRCERCGRSVSRDTGRWSGLRLCIDCKSDSWYVSKITGKR